MAQQSKDPGVTMDESPSSGPSRSSRVSSGGAFRTNVADEARARLAELFSGRAGGRSSRAWLLLLVAPLLFIAAVLASALWAAPGSSRDTLRVSPVGPELVLDELSPSKGEPAGLSLEGIEAGAIVRFARRDLALRNFPGFAYLDLVRDGNVGSDRRWRVAENVAGAEGDGARLRLGDAALAGEVDGRTIINAVVFDPVRRFADLGPLPDSLAASADELRRRLPQSKGTAGDTPTPFSTHPAIVRAAAVVALLKADRLGVERIAFAPPWSDGPASPDALSLPTEVWVDALRRAARATALYLHNVERIDVLIEWSPEPVQQRADGGTPLPGMPASAWHDTVTTTFERRFAMALPWTNAGEMLTPRRLPPNASADERAQGSSAEAAPARLEAASLNPALRGHGQLTSVPLWVALAAYALAFAWLFRRRAPVRFHVRPSLLLALPLSALFVLVLALAAHASRAWVGGVSAPLGDAGESLLLLAGGTLATGMLGLLAGAGVFLAGARPVRTPEPLPEAKGEVADGASAVRRYLYTDNPVTDPREDRLGFAAIAEALADFLDNRGTKPPVVIAVNGPWGSGKSSVMRMLASILERRQRFRIAWFNAWQYQQEEQLLAAFLKTVATELSRRWGALFGLRLAWIRLRNASVGQLLLVLLPISVLAFGLLMPETAAAWARAVGLDDRAGAFAQLVTLLFGGGGSAALLRFALPFRLSFRRLLSSRDVSQRIGFLDAFQQEFRYYREAVGREKFVIVVDDLDRCHPEAVVEVLKSINLIVNSDDGPGKTFFVLGFDADYIERSVQHAFREFTEAQDGGAPDFGRNYLKKIVTVGVSVPVPQPGQLEELAQVLGTGSEPDKGLAETRPTPLEKAGRAASGLLDGMRRPLPVVVLFLAALFAFAVLQRPADPAERVAGQPGPSSEERAGVPGDGTASTAGSSDAAALVVLPPSATKPEAGTMDWLLPPIEALALIGFFVASAGVLASAARYLRAPPEPVDPAAFAEAIDRLTAHLPHNPRDLIRLINRMRLDYLLQAGRSSSLVAEDSTALTLLRENHRDLLDDPAVFAHFLPQLERHRDLDKALDAAAGEAPDWVAAARHALSDLPPARDAFGDPDGLRHFLHMQGRVG